MMEGEQFARFGRRSICKEIIGEIPGWEVSCAKAEHSLRTEADEAGLRSDTFSHGSGEEKTSQYMLNPKTASACTSPKPQVTTKLKEILNKYLCAGEGLVVTNGDRTNLAMYCSSCSFSDDSQHTYATYAYKPTRPTRPGKGDSLSVNVQPPVNRRTSSFGSTNRDSFRARSVTPMTPVAEDSELILHTAIEYLSPRTANAMCLNSVTQSTANSKCSSENNSAYSRPRASSETPMKMAPVPLINRASSIGPTVGLQKKHSFRDNGIYECNYESIDAYSSGGSTQSNSDSSQAILKLENAVKSIDNVLAKESVFDVKSEKCNKVQYDSITVLPTRAVTEMPPPPPPLPRTRSFKDRARTVHPWVSQLNATSGRASSAPPISPMHQRKLLFSDR